MTSFTFTLQPFEVRTGSRTFHRFGLRGEAGPFGQVEVEYPVVRDDDTDLFRAEVRGERVPTAGLTGRAYSYLPSLGSATLDVEGRPVALRRNWWALTRRARALHLDTGTDRYTYTAVGTGKDFELRRAEAGILLRHRGWTRKRTTVEGRASGPVNAVDVALAVLLEGVDTRNLTFSKAVRWGPFRVMYTLS
ncbi:hypothetical protein [Streptomyces sp. NPDC018031]|uniref:hypothetical protein n=1 Tax=Streptomyces sp. NPDC018031 TaxID=3365033 RepID=UPI0037AB3E54